MIELTEELAACLHQAEASKAWFERRFLQLARHQIWWRPMPSTWSIGECVNHLNKTLASYLPKVEEAIERGWRESRTTRGFSQYGWHTNHVLKVLEPPVRVSHLAANPLHPLVPVERDLLVRQFYEQRKRYAEALCRANGLDLVDVEVDSMIQPLVPSLGGTLAMLAAHDRRHMWEAEWVRKSPGFPLDCKLTSQEHFFRKDNHHEIHHR
jgi:hypothetical protein